MAVEPAEPASEGGKTSAEASRPHGNADASPSADPERSADPDRPGDFERYALIAALTLVVLCLLLWDRWQSAPARSATPPADRTLRVEIGGDAGRAPAQRGEQRRGPDERTVTSDPPVGAPVPVVSAPRRYTVKDGDTLSEIARRELGSAARAREIADLNGLTDAGKVRIGQVLTLPEE